MTAEISAENKELLVWLASRGTRSEGLERIISLLRQSALREAASPKLRKRLQEISSCEGMIRDYLRNRCYDNIPLHINRLQSLSELSDAAIHERVEDIREHEILQRLAEAKRLASLGAKYGRKPAWREPYESAVSMAFAKIPENPVRGNYKWVLDVYKSLDRQYNAAMAAKRPTVA